MDVVITCTCTSMYKYMVKNNKRACRDIKPKEAQVLEQNCDLLN